MLDAGVYSLIKRIIDTDRMLVILCNREELEFRLYPIGGKEFGRKGGMIRLTFSEGCLKYADLTCKKVEK